MSKVIPVWYNRKLLREQILDPNILFNTAKNEKGKIVGIVAVSKVDRQTLLIRRLYVHPRHQRRHIGIKLMKNAIESFRGIKTIRLEVVKENRKARYFYLRHGFKLVKTHEVDINGMPQLLIVMEKSKK
jgi:ribosomal protein S18 acetylase RimI-like enzyme